MITTINEFKKLNEYHVEMPKKIELTYVRTDDNGNFIYKGTNGEMYQEVEGVIHDVTDQGEPLAPVHNVVIKKGDPIYNPEDRFGRNPGSKVAESVVNTKVDDNTVIVKETGLPTDGNSNGEQILFEVKNHGEYITVKQTSGNQTITVGNGIALTKLINALQQCTGRGSLTEQTINEESGDYSTETHAIADVISKNIENLVKGETSGILVNKSEDIDLMHGLVKFEISDPNMDTFYNGQIVVEIFDNISNGGDDDDSDGTENKGNKNGPDNYEQSRGLRDNY